MELLGKVKHYQTYKKLRKEELALKQLLKKKIIEIQEEVSKFSEILPKTKKENVATSKDGSKQPRRRKTLQEEINEIRQRIAELQ